MRVLPDVSLATLREYIDWTPFFHTWELKGVYPRILEHEKYGEQARQIFAEGNALLDTIVEKKLLTARGVYGLFPAQRRGRRRRALHRRRPRARSASGSTSCGSRRRRTTASRRAAWATSSRPRASGLRDHLGGFAVTTGIGLKELCDRFRARERRLQRHHGRGAGRPAGRGLRRVPAQAWCATSGATATARTSPRSSSSTRSTAASARRPATPPAPITPRRGRSGGCSTSRSSTGMLLTESFAMWPGSSVSGLYFAHPESRYFTLGKIDRDQVADYAARKGMTVPEVERWLGPNLNYDPGN